MTRRELLIAVLRSSSHLDAKLSIRVVADINDLNTKSVQVPVSHANGLGEPVILLNDLQEAMKGLS